LQQGTAGVGPLALSHTAPAHPFAQPSSHAPHARSPSWRGDGRAAEPAACPYACLHGRVGCSRVQHAWASSRQRPILTGHLASAIKPRTPGRAKFFSPAERGVRCCIHHDSRVAMRAQFFCLTAIFSCASTANRSMRNSPHSTANRGSSLAVGFKTAVPVPCPS
jgi:hypothetical protein